jgi:hypothetical protein
MTRIKKALYVLSWIPVIILKALAALLGLIMVPICLGTVDGEFTGLFWLWGNDEEGCPEWWLERAADGKAGKVAQWFPRFWWYAIRNPVNNSRFIFKEPKRIVINYHGNWRLQMPMEPQQLLDAGQGMAYLWRAAGPFAGYRRVWLNGDDRYSEVWIGWKVGSLVPGMGFATQVRLKRKIGG